jgi:FMN phosphatase YigB (HAD superfamily)
MSRFRCILFDWGGTLMSEEGPQDRPMALWPEVTVIPDARETLATLAPTHRIAIATNASISTRDMIELALERAKLREWISDIFCFTEIGARKDSPAFWNAVTSGLRLPAGELAMVGDSLEQDVVAPRRFGVYSAWFNEGHRHGAAPDGVPMVHRLADVVPLLEKA